MSLALQSSYKHPNYSFCSIQDNWMATLTREGEVSVWDTNKSERQWSQKTDLTISSRPIVDVKSDTLVCHDWTTINIFSLKTGKLRAAVVAQSPAHRIHLFVDTLFAKIGTQIKSWDLTGKPLSDIDDSENGCFVVHQGKCISITEDPSNLDISVRDMATNRVNRIKSSKLIRYTTIIAQGQEIIFGVKSKKCSGIMVSRLNLKSLICKTYSVKGEQSSDPEKDIIGIAVNEADGQVFAGNFAGRIVTFDPDGKSADFGNCNNGLLDLFVYNQFLISIDLSCTFLWNIKDRTRIASFKDQNHRSPSVIVGKNLFVPGKNLVRKYQFQDEPAQVEKYESKEELSYDCEPV